MFCTVGVRVKTRSKAYKSRLPTDPLTLPIEIDTLTLKLSRCDLEKTTVTLIIIATVWDKFDAKTFSSLVRNNEN